MKYTLKDFAETLTLCLLAAGLSLVGVAFIQGGIYVLWSGLFLFTMSLASALLIDHKEVVEERKQEVKV